MAAEVEALLGARREAGGEEGLCKGGAVAVCADQQGHVAGRVARCEVVLDPFHGPGGPGFGAGVFRGAVRPAHVDGAFEGVDGGLGRCIPGIQRAEVLGEQVGDCLEYEVVELYYGAAGPVILTQRIRCMLADQGPFCLPQRICQRSTERREGHELAVIAVAPTVDGLLCIADHQAAAPRRQDVGHELHEVVPLRDGRVLELVDEDVLEAGPDALEDERSWVFSHNGGNLSVERRERADVALFAQAIQFLAQER